MAFANCLHLTPLAHTLRPFLPRQTPLLRPHLRRLSNLPGVYTLSSDRYKLPVQPVFALARRSFSSMAKEEAVASPADLLFEGPLKIVEYPDPILRSKNKRVNTFDESLKRLADEMFDVMYRTDGIGLSAPQVGINVELMVFNPVGERGEGEEIVLVNPRIKRFSKKIVPFEEGCLSFPGIYADVERPDSLQVDAQDVTGAKFEVNLTGLPARVFQHEYDHLQALEKKYEEQTGLPSPERIDKLLRVWHNTSRLKKVTTSFCDCVGVDGHGLV
ncbi:peptide deformylase 1b chloroplastic [Phtheirospermum japonicum]|uniref:Peptide deformylase n=1 Tax=Phtheirospermum japonicum TaxID=374723 RepID=A0A830CV78_9LAMI|nr:peptide deformylase 1b chloroplastic [Phtheirospermum japonicum]